MNTLSVRRFSHLIVAVFAASLMIFVTGVFAQTTTPTAETEITGVLEKITSGSVVVSGQTISIVGAEIKNPLVVGGSVKVHASTVNGVLTAREIESVPTAGADDNNNDNGNANANDNTNANGNLNSNDNIDDNGNDNISTMTPPGVSLQQAIDIVLAVYPTTDILSIELTSKFGGTQVWEVKIRNGIELNIDAQSSAILTIERRGDNNNGGSGSNGNLNGNGNSNDNRDDNGNLNGNNNGNDNNDDHGNDNGNDNNDDHGGNRGGGSDDGGGDDSSGMG